MRFQWIIALILCLLCLIGCSQAETSRLFLCQVVPEEGDGFSCPDPARTVEPNANVVPPSHLCRNTATNLFKRDGYTLIGWTFYGCEQLATLYLNAVEPPVYSGTYYDTFQDKSDRLLSLRDKKKIILFSGSSIRSGYDSEKPDEAFPDYEIVNMGVFAYTNARPQLELILICMDEGDILLHCTEFDTSKRQFCTSADLDEPFYNMMESDHDTVSLLDLREYGLIFTPLSAYLTTRDDMGKKTYALSASGLPAYGLPVHCTVAAFPGETFIEPIITEPEDSLWPGTYLYGTDDHLSTEGAAIHTDRIIAALEAQLAAEETGGTP